MTSVTSLPESERDKLSRILSLAIEHGRIQSVLKVLDNYPDAYTLPVTLAKGTASAATQKTVHFVEACVVSNLPIGIVRAIANGFDVNAKVCNGTTVLDYACDYGHKILASLVLGLGADPNAFNDDPANVNAMSPLLRTLYRASQFKEETDFQLPKILLGCGADPNWTRKQGKETCVSVLASADWSGRVEIMSQLLADLVKAGADVNASQGGVANMKPLRLAIGKRNAAGALALIHLGAQTSVDAIGDDVFQLFDAMGLAEHLPALTDAIMRRSLREAQDAAKAAGIVPEETQKRQRTAQIL